MAINLLDLLKTAVSGQVAEQIGSLTGIDKNKSASAVEAAIPVLLGSLVKKASTPSGASDLSKMLKDQDTSILDNLGGLLGGSGSSDLLSMGTRLLPSLLGGSQSSIISTLVKLLGFNDKTIGSLLGMLAPIVMSVVGKQAKAAGGFDPGVLTNLLGSQNNFLSAALPNELKGAMGMADMLGNKATQAVNTASRAAAETTKQAGNPLQWILPLVALAALGYLGYTFFNQKPAEKADTVVTTPKMEVPKVDLPDLGDIKKNLDTTFGGLTSVLEGITDVDSAKGALTKIEDAAKAYEGLAIDKLPDAAKTGLAPFLKPYVTKVSELIEKLYAIPGVKDIVEPAIGPMLKAVTGLAS